MYRIVCTLLLILTGKLLTAQLTYQRLYVDYDSTYRFGNLRIIPVRPKGPGRAAGPDLIGFGEAMQRGLLTVTERGTAAVENVHWLMLYNHSTKPVFIASGEIVTGGRQDRMVSADTILVPNGRDQYIPAMCVEEDRWTEKKKVKPFSYSGYANPRLRRQLDETHNQVLIWNEVYNQLDSNHIKSPSLAYTDFEQQKEVAPKMTESIDYFMDKLHDRDSSVVGFVCVSGNKILGCDVFAGRNLFEGELRGLLTGYVQEATAFGAAPTVPPNKVKQYMDKILSGEDSQEKYLKKHGKIFRAGQQVIHITAYAD